MKSFIECCVVNNDSLLGVGHLLVTVRDGTIFKPRAT
jgi:hypothetical protein